MRNVLVVVDMQNDFVDGSLGSPEAQAIVNSVVREIKDKSYTQILYTMDTHQMDYLETLEGKNLPVEHCIRDTKGWALNEKVFNAIKERFKDDCDIDSINKSTFGSIALPEYVDDSDIIESITICGLCTDVCVISNALMLRAHFKDTPMYYVKDACAGITPETHEAACKVMESCQIYNKEK